MTRRSGNKSSNNNATTTTLDIGKKPVVATTATEDTVEAASSSSKAGDDDDKTMMASTNDNDDTLPIEDAMTVNDATGATTDAGVVAAVIEESATMMEPSNEDDDDDHGGVDANPETSLEIGCPDNDDNNDADNSIKAAISEDHVIGEDDGDAEEQVELWDLKVVLSAKQIRMAQPTLCQSDKCNLVACCIWSSNLDPETPWYSCLDCQEEHFGGWPSTEESDGSGGTGLPIKVLSDDLREAMMDKCTQLVDPVMPNLPSSIGVEVMGGTKASDGNEATSNDDTEEAADDADDDDGEVLWELKKVFSIKELTKSKPMKCKTDDCDRLACSVWKSSEGDSWYSCLDCQEK